MFEVSISHWIEIVCVALLASLSMAIVIYYGFFQQGKGLHPNPAKHRRNIFLFRDEILMDHDSLCALTDPHMRKSEVTWGAFRIRFLTSFPDLPEHLYQVEPESPIELGTNTDEIPTRLHLSRKGRMARLELVDHGHLDAYGRFQAKLMQKTAREFAFAFNNARDQIWLTDLKGRLIWGNSAVRKLPAGHFRKLSCLDDISLTAGTVHDRHVDFEAEAGHLEFRYDLKQSVTNRTVIHIATDTTKKMHAGKSQQDVVQSLSKTFANLTIGLAIFDRNRRLILFNPALMDLTELQPGYLSARPDLMGFFDRLRNQQIMPEPRNFADWRVQITEMMKAASSGHYRETWNLASGKTFEITGRPYPDGSVAFLFRDITAEVSQTRSFRFRIDMGQVIVDQLDDAIAVISHDNVAMIHNLACYRLLGLDPASGLREMPLKSLLDLCAGSFPDSELWTEIHEKIIGRMLDTKIRDIVRARSGQLVECHVSAHAGIGTILRLSPQRGAYEDKTRQMVKSGS